MSKWHIYRTLDKNAFSKLNIDYSSKEIHDSLRANGIIKDLFGYQMVDFLINIGCQNNFYGIGGGD